MKAAKRAKTDPAEVDALLVIFNAEGKAIGTVPVRVPALAEDDHRLALQAAGALHRLNEAE